MLALDLYKNRKVSLGYCASVAEMSKEEFVQYLSMNGISIFAFDSENEYGMIKIDKLVKDGMNRNGDCRISVNEPIG